MTTATTYEELKKYDRTVVRYRGIEGMLYLEGDILYLLNNALALSGATPEDDGGMWKTYGYRHSWYISQEYYNLIELPIDYNKLEELLCS